jgi:hypothetical protein
MARHNREGQGADQRGFDYTISYQPDWLELVKVTRHLESGRQSTKTLFRNPGRREQRPGRRVRTVVSSPEQGLEFEVVVNDPGRVVKRVIVETCPAPHPGEEAASTSQDVVFTIDGRPIPKR